MSDERWAAVDRYITDNLIGPDAALDAALKANAAAGLPAIDVAPNQGKMLHLLARMQGARRILEIGMLGGYSTIWMARAMGEGGRLISLELEQKHADVARENLKRAGVGERVEVRVGPAAESLARLHEEGAGPFDMVFIDADKQRIPVYLEWALKLSRPGTLIVVDNVVRDGAVVDAESEDASVQGVRAMFAMIAREPRLSATALQTVGSKGYDGLVMALVQ